MIPRSFELHTPSTLEEAVSLLKKRDSKVLAGGQSLVPLMKLRLVSPAHLVDIGRIPGLSYIKKENGRFVIGSMTVHNDVANSPIINSQCRALAEAAGHIGDQQVRNRGTIGGTICHADPAGDVPAAVLALDAGFKVAGPSKTRVIKAGDFFQGIFTTCLQAGEILTEVRVPIPPPNSGGAYLKLERGSSDLAIVGVATVVTLDRAGKCADARIALAGVGPTPLRATQAENELKGKRPTADVVTEAAEKAGDASKPSSDPRGSADYKREMVKVHTRRAIALSLSRI